MTPDEIKRAVTLVTQLEAGNASATDEAYDDKLVAAAALVSAAIAAGTPLHAIDVQGNALAALLIAQIREELYPNGEVVPTAALPTVTPSIVAEQELAARNPLNLLIPAPKPIMTAKARKKSFWERMGEGLKAIVSDPVGYLRGRVETHDELHTPGNAVDQVVTGLATTAVGAAEGAAETAVAKEAAKL